MIYSGFPWVPVASEYSAAMIAELMVDWPRTVLATAPLQCGADLTAVSSAPRSSSPMTRDPLPVDGGLFRKR